jgi:hypothetical protein
MADHVAGSVRYYLAVKKEHIDDLVRIRQWTNLKVGFEEGLLWIKDLDYAQAHSVEVKSLPFKTIYYEKDGKLVLLDHLLSERTTPSVLWTPIDRALAVKLPSLNHNYFGITEKLSVRLVPTGNEMEGIAMIISLTVLKNYIETAPSFRLQHLRWCILHGNSALLIGKPFLPLPGKTYWQRKDFLLPAGVDFDLPLLTNALDELINPDRAYFILWNEDATYSVIAKTSMTSLSRSSFHLTMAQPSINA